MIRTYPMQQSSVLRLYSEREQINMSPPYQRNGDIWNLEKKQLLIDSILNEYDVPKLYFHSNPKGKFEYAVIDGRQRLETFFGFIDGEFPLSDDFEYYNDEKIKVSGLKYDDLSKINQKLKIRFDSYSLPVILVETDDILLIDDMFSRLNEAVPLNAAEKRNAFGGNAVKVINNIAGHKFFTDKVRFTNRRYQHQEVSVRIMFITWSIINNDNRIIDTKKQLMDDFVKRNKKTKLSNTEKEVCTNLDQMVEIFLDKDELLRSQASVPIYYLVTRLAIRTDQTAKLDRDKFLEFREKIDENRRIASVEIGEANFSFLEYDRLSQQGTNDATSIVKRFRIMSEYLGLLKPDPVDD